MFLDKLGPRSFLDSRRVVSWLESRPFPDKSRGHFLTRAESFPDCPLSDRLWTLALGFLTRASRFLARVGRSVSRLAPLRLLTLAAPPALRPRQMWDPRLLVVVQTKNNKPTNKQLNKHEMNPLYVLFECAAANFLHAFLFFELGMQKFSDLMQLLI